ncbi:MAG: hypothetical protein ACKOQ3_00990 [Novosphingobium sp.]
MLNLFMAWKFVLQDALVVIVAVMCWRYGAGPERYSASVLVVASIADKLLHFIVGRGATFTSLETGHLVYDLATLAAFLAIALKANRCYPLWLSSIQGIAVMGHFAAGLKTAAPTPYAVMAIMPSYLLILTLYFGIRAHRRRTVQFGHSRAWRRDSAAIPATQHNLKMS